MIKIGVDAMGGDNAPITTIEGAIKAVKKFKDLEVTLYGKKDVISKYLNFSERIKIVDCSEIIGMDEKEPLSAMKRSKESSMAKVMVECKEDKVDGVVSAGATQALIAGAHLILRRLKGVKRTALAPIIPSIDKLGRLMLDVGANTSIKEDHVIGQVYFATITAKEVLNIENPRVGLLNIGEEESKGREFEKNLYNLLKEDENINFVGNIETNQILEPNCDILITDGFTGNMILKTLEGALKGSGKILKEEFSRSIFSKIGYLFAKKSLKNYKNRLSADNIGGAMLFGVSRPLVKAHGSSNSIAFYNAIRQCYQIVKSDVLNKVVNIINKKEN